MKLKETITPYDGLEKVWELTYNGRVYKTRATSAYEASKKLGLSLGTCSDVQNE